MNDNKKWCPLNPDTDINIPCTKEHCGWWDEDKNQCAVVTLAKEISKIGRK